MRAKTKTMIVLFVTTVFLFLAGLFVGAQPAKTSVSADTSATVYDIGELGETDKSFEAGTTTKIGKLSETVTSASNVGIKFTLDATIAANTALKFGTFRSESGNAWSSGGHMVQIFCRYVEARGNWGYWLEICDPSSNDNVLEYVDLGYGVSLDTPQNVKGIMEIKLQDGAFTVSFGRLDTGGIYTVSTTTVASTWGQNFNVYADNVSGTISPFPDSKVYDIGDLGETVKSFEAGSTTKIATLPEAVAPYTNAGVNVGIKFTLDATIAANTALKFGAFRSESGNAWSSGGHMVQIFCRYVEARGNWGYWLEICDPSSNDNVLEYVSLGYGVSLDTPQNVKGIMEIKLQDGAFTVSFTRADTGEIYTVSTTTIASTWGQNFNVYADNVSGTISPLPDLKVYDLDELGEETKKITASGTTTVIAALPETVSSYSNVGIKFNINATIAANTVLKFGTFRSESGNAWSSGGQMVNIFCRYVEARGGWAYWLELCDPANADSVLEYVSLGYGVSLDTPQTIEGTMEIKLEDCTFTASFTRADTGETYTVSTTTIASTWGKNFNVYADGVSAATISSANNNYTYDEVVGVYDLSVINSDTTGIEGASSAPTYIGGLGADVLNKGVTYKLITPAQSGVVKLGLFKAAGSQVWGGAADGYILQYSAGASTFQLCNGDNGALTDAISVTTALEHTIETYVVTRYNNGVADGYHKIVVKVDGTEILSYESNTITVGGEFNGYGDGTTYTVRTTYTYTYAEATLTDVWNLTDGSASVSGASAGYAGFGSLPTAMNNGVLFVLETPAQSGTVKLGLYKSRKTDPWGGATDGYLLQYNAGDSTLQLCDGDNNVLSSAVSIDTALVHLFEISIVERYKDGVADGYSKLVVKVDEVEVLTWVANTMTIGEKFNGYGDGTAYTVSTTLEIPTATMFDVSELSEGLAINQYEAGNSHRLGALPNGVNEGVKLRISYPTAEGWIVVGLYRENADFNSGDAKGYTLWIYRNSETNLSFKLKTGYSTEVVNILENNTFGTAFGEYIDLEIYALENPNGSHTIYVAIEGELRGTYTSSEVSLGNWFNIHNQLSVSITAETDYSRLQISNNGTLTNAFVKDTYVLPAIEAQEGKIFLGWTETENDYSKLYPVGYAYEATEDATLYTAWINASDFAMQYGAAVRLTEGETGIRFLTDISAKLYNDLGASIAEIGTILAPTAKLTNEFTEQNYPEAVKIAVEQWKENGEDAATWTYVAALIDIPQTQYNRQISARGYILINYANGTTGYVYTDYTKEANARSIYEVAVAAKNDEKTPWYATNETILGYVDGVADLTLDENLEVGSTEEGSYKFSALNSEGTFTVTFDKAVYGLLINGERVNASTSPAIEIGGEMYLLSGYAISGEYTQITFTVTKGKYLDAPVLSYGEGYTVTWEAVEDAAYYVVHDSNSHTGDITVNAGETLAYTPVVVGEHEISVTAYPDTSVNPSFRESEARTIQSVEVKPVWAYQSVRDGYFWFTAAQMSAAGLNTSEYGYDEASQKYRVYVKADGTYTPNASEARNWATAEHIGTLLDQQKALGLNVVLVENMGGQFNENDVWENSALKVVMDAAWARGMKVLVADSYIFNFAGNERNGTEGSLLTSEAEITAAVKARLSDGTEASNYVKHDAFYGFTLADEPTTGDMVTALSATVAGLREAVAALRTDIEPFMHAALTIAYSQSFTDIKDFKTYVKDWIDGTGCNYVCFNLYVDSVMDWGYNYQDRYSSTYDALMEVAADYDNVDLYQTLTAWTQEEELEAHDVYASMLYAAAFGNKGIAWFNYFPVVEASATISGTIVDYAGNANDTYTWVQGANEQFVKLQGLLNGYSLSGYELTDKSYINKNWMSKPDYYRSATTTFTNATSGATATMKVNIVTQSEGLGYKGENTLETTVTQTVASGKTYYIFGVNGVSQGIGTGANVTLSQGQAILIFN